MTSQHLVSLVLQSKKALQHSEQLCSRANSLSNESSSCATEILALDAKVKWISDAVIEQLKLAANLARDIEQKRAELFDAVKEWDTIRSERINALDVILDSLGTQLVPPDFHQASSESSIFGSPQSDKEPQPKISPIRIPNGTERTLRGRVQSKRSDRKTWKTLRDFVDEVAIEDVLESIEEDRTALDDTLAKTEYYPESLNASITTIRNCLPMGSQSPSIKGILTEQEAIRTNLANHLESLADHYDQMVRACSEIEAGEQFSEEDLQEMNRDVVVLPVIMTELEENVASIEKSYKQLLAARDMAQHQFDSQRNTLEDLDELADIMAEMVESQRTVEADFAERLEGLQQHLFSIGELQQRFVLYQTAFNKLLVEIARRRQYREAAALTVRNMAAKLDAMTEDERRLRAKFNREYGQHIPTDLCLCAENPPTKWEIVPFNGEGPEVLPVIENDLLAQAKDRILVDTPVAEPESL